MDKNLGEALRLIRVYNDLSQKNLAEKLEISAGYLSEIESGKKEPTLSFINKYAEVLQMKPAVILFFSEKIGTSTSKLMLQKLFIKTLQIFEDLEQDESINQ